MTKINSKIKFKLDLFVSLNKKCKLFAGIIFFWFFLGFSTNISAQNVFGIKKSVQIPFEYYNNFIIIDVQFNKTLPLKFIFDTGAEHTVLLKKEIAKVMNIPFQRRFQIIGSDMKTELYAYLIRQINLKINTINIPNQSLLVLEDDYFDFEKKIGTEISGILGADIFRAYRVRIDYVGKYIELSPSDSEEPKGRGFTKFPLEIYKNKPYVKTKINTVGKTEIDVKLLIDTGAGLGLLLHTDTHSDLNVPDQVITGQVGAGLGGGIDGVIGRVKRLSFPGTNIKLSEIVTNFQEINETLDTSQLNGRNGLIGNQILERFEMIIDYPRSFIYLKPNRRYKQKFKFDRSGLVLIAAGFGLNKYYVSHVLADSPAHEAGIIRGDRIIKINGTSVALTNLDMIVKRLKGKVNKRTRLVLRRGTQKMKREFRLRDLI